MQDAPQPKCKVEKKLFQQERSNNLNYHAQGGGGVSPPALGMVVDLGRVPSVKNLLARL